MSELIASTLVAIALVAVLDTLVSKTKNGLIVKKVISLLSISLILVPICDIIANQDFSYKNTESDTVFAEYLINLEVETIKQGVKTLLLKEGFTVENVQVVTDGVDTDFSIKKIKVKLNNLGISENGEHIHILENVTKLIKDYVKNDKVEVEIET